MHECAVLAASVEARLVLEILVLAWVPELVLKQFDDRLVVVQSSFIERRISKRILVPRVDTILQQSFHDLDVADRCRLQHRRVTILVAHVQVCSLLDKKVEQTHVLEDDGIMQHRVPAVHIDWIVYARFSREYGGLQVV